MNLSLAHLLLHLFPHSNTFYVPAKIAIIFRVATNFYRFTAFNFDFPNIPFTTLLKTTMIRYWKYVKNKHELISSKSSY